MGIELVIFKIKYNGDIYKYDIPKMVWAKNGYAVYPKEIPNEVKQMRENLIDTVSEGI